jgi:hypothetical protein
LSAESVDGPDDEIGELAAVRVVEHPLQRLAVLAFVGGGLGDLVASCDLPAAVVAEPLDVWDLAVLVLALGGHPDPDRQIAAVAVIELEPASGEEPGGPA